MFNSYGKVGMGYSFLMEKGAWDFHLLWKCVGFLYYFLVSWTDGDGIFNSCKKVGIGFFLNFRGKT